jgi:hypothetical protein
MASRLAAVDRWRPREPLRHLEAGPPRQRPSSAGTALTKGVAGRKIRAAPGCESGFGTPPGPPRTPPLFPDRAAERRHFSAELGGSAHSSRRTERPLIAGCLAHQSAPATAVQRSPYIHRVMYCEVTSRAGRPDPKEGRGYGCPGRRIDVPPDLGAGLAARSDRDPGWSGHHGPLQALIPG